MPASDARRCPPHRVRWSLLVPVGAVARRLDRDLRSIALTGVSIGDAVAAFVDGAFGSPYSIAASINRSVVFALVGIGFVLANRANLTNVGGEGQIAVGGIAATAVALYGGVANLPLGLAFLVPMLAAVLAGAFWGAIAGVLKVKAGPTRSSARCCCRSSPSGWSIGACSRRRCCAGP